MKCTTKGCNNPASGMFECKTRGKFVRLDPDTQEPIFTRPKTLNLEFCSQCGLMAHNKRSYNLVVEDGVERETFPMAYKSVRLLYSFTETKFHKPAMNPPTLTCYCGHDKGSHELSSGACRECEHCNGFYDGACTNEP